jgi:hypothetical protein
MSYRARAFLDANQFTGQHGAGVAILRGNHGFGTSRHEFRYDARARASSSSDWITNPELGSIQTR